MRLYYSILIVMILLVASSCNKKIKDKVVQAPPVKTEQEEVQAEMDMTLDTAATAVIPVERPKFIVIELKTENCYGGGCPEYEFSLNNDGIAFYQCKSSCRERRGSFHAFVGRDKSDEILDFIKANDMLRLNSVYPENGKAVDYIPATHFKLALDNRSIKEVKSYHHTPASLLTLQRIVEEMIQEVEWERSLE